MERKKTLETDAKIIQMMEVTKEVYAVYEEENGTEWFQPVFMATLDDEGVVRLHSNDVEGQFYMGSFDAENFLRYHYGPRPPQGGKSNGRV